jgi:V-type H+-transporting ATPase subunit C
MSKASTFILVSLPTSISSSLDKEDALSALRRTVGDNGATYPFNLPTFKIGTLDALVRQADDLAKLDTACRGVVGKVAESLKGILDGDEDKTAQHKTINDSKFHW